MAVEIDIVEGSSVSQSADGFTAVRRAIVSGLTGSKEQRMFNALIDPGIPPRGQFHPVIPNLKVTDKVARALDSGIVQVDIIYKLFTFVLQEPDDAGPTELSVGSSLQEEETNLDINDVQMTVKHTFQDVDADGNAAPRTVEQGGRVNIQIPLTIIRLKRRETSNPLDKSKEFTSRVNSGTFLGDPERVWLCTRIEGGTDDAEESFIVNYEFQRRLPNWDATVIFIDPDTGESPPDLVEGEGIRTFVVYPSADFSQLNLNV